VFLIPSATLSRARNINSDPESRVKAAGFGASHLPAALIIVNVVLLQHDKVRNCKQLSSTLGKKKGDGFDPLRFRLQNLFIKNRKIKSHSVFILKFNCDICRKSLKK
jgi:hypothetical protein